MLDGWKAYNSPLCDKLRRCIKVSLCILFFFSIAAAVFSFSFSGVQYLRSCPDCSKPLTAAAVRPPPPAAAAPPTNISHVLFGIAGSVSTWHKRRRYSELWWRPGLMRGHVWLDAPPPPLEPWPESCPPYVVSRTNTSRYGIRADAARIARIAAEAYGMEAAGTTATATAIRWLVMGDDDTVFFPENVVGVLGRYDHEEMWYIGAASESVEQDEMHSYGMAFGGGGFAVSLPAAAALAGAIDGCLDRYAELYGSDQRVHACFTELGVPLTREPGFHQVDLRGDLYGMLAAHPVAPVISLHHLNYVKPISPLAATQLDALRSLVAASRSDSARTLQQTVCYLREPGRRGLSWSVSVSWGYTVQLYPWALPPKDLVVPLQTFQTWRSWSGGPFTFNTRSLPGPDRPCERPVRYFLDRVKKGPSGSTTTEYTKYVAEDEKGMPRCERHGFNAASRVDAVRVFARRTEADIWRRAPRRQCCEARRVGWLTRRTVEVTVRDCFAGEITTPPP